MVQREIVRRLEHVRPVAGAEDLAAGAAPGRVVDAVDPVLDLHDDAAVLLRDAGAGGVVEEALGFLEGEGAVEAIAAVDLEGFLLGVDVELDTREGRGEGGDGGLAPVVGALGVTVEDVAGVVAEGCISMDIWEGACRYCMLTQCSCSRSYPRVQARRSWPRAASARSRSR